MPCSWSTSDLQLLLILTVCLVAGYISAGVEGPATSSNSTQLMGQNNNSLAALMDGKQNHSKVLAEANTSLAMLVDTKVVLSCPDVPLTTAVSITWEVIFKDKSSCSRTHWRVKNETTEVTCTGKRITWPHKPDNNTVLQLDPVAITHEGSYKCDVATAEGNFNHEYDLQVLVAPEVTLCGRKNRTAVCKAVAGKPAARISWTPEGNCVPDHKFLDNGKVTVQSTCHWVESNVSTVSCSVSHETRNWSLSIGLNQDAKTPEYLYIVYIILPIFILVIMGSIWLLKIIGCRKCKLKKTEPAPAVEEDEMQPYESYTEKTNPLYDTTNNLLKTSQVLQSEVDKTNLHTL